MDRKTDPDLLIVVTARRGLALAAGLLVICGGLLVRGSARCLLGHGARC